MNRHFLIGVFEWCASKPEGFSRSELFECNELNPQQTKIVEDYIYNAANHFYYSRDSLPRETIFHVLTPGPNTDFKDEKWRFTLTLDSLFNYIDYSELKFARENAREARGFAIAAIIVSVIVPVLISILFTQNVRLVN